MLAEANLEVPRDPHLGHPSIDGTPTLVGLVGLKGVIPTLTLRSTDSEHTSRKNRSSRARLQMGQMPRM